MIMYVLGLKTEALFYRNNVRFDIYKPQAMSIVNAFGWLVIFKAGVRFSQDDTEKIMEALSSYLHLTLGCPMTAFSS